MNNKNMQNLSLYFNKEINIRNSFICRMIIIILFILVITTGLVLTSFYNYLLFHTLVELFSITVSFAVFILVWNARNQIDNNFFAIVGISFIAVAGIDIVHLLSYKGMPVFNTYDSNLPTQLWVASRYVLSLSLLAAFFFTDKKISFYLVLVIYCLLTFVIFITIFIRIFPDCYTGKEGLTDFKKISEFIIVGIFLIDAVLLFRIRKRFERNIFIYLTLIIFFSILTELTFTTYFDVYDLSNMVGHILKFLSCVLWYLSIVKTGISRPSEILYRKLNESEKRNREMIANISDVIAIMDINNILVYISPNIEKFFGWKNEEIINTNGFERIHPDDLDRIKNEYKELMNDDKSEKKTEFRYKCSDGNYKMIEIMAVNLLHDDIINGVLMNFRDITRRKQFEEKIKKLLSEKEIILKEVHHRIKNNLNSVYSLLCIQAEHADGKSSVDVLKDAAGRVNTMMVLYDKLFQSDNFNIIHIKEYTECLIDEILKVYSNTDRIKVEKNIIDFTLDPKKLQNIGVIINELLTNIMKYAFKEDESGGLIKISVRSENGKGIIVIQDNGSGIPENINFENITHFGGLMLVDLITKQINGTIKVERINGSRFVIEFDI